LDGLEKQTDVAKVENNNPDALVQKKVGFYLDCE
jgi:hypothetical protein